MNEAFAYWITTRKPFVTLKSALTLDGQLALPSKGNNKKRVWITGEEARAEVQRMRHRSDAVLTGSGTILADDPLLTDRSGLTRRRRLLRVIVDSKLRLPLKARIVETADDDVVVFTGASLKSAKARALGKAGVEVVAVKLRRGRVDLVDVMKELGRRDNLSVMIEAGPRLNAAALSASVVNRMMLFYAPKFAGDTRVPFLGAAIESMPELHLRGYREFGADIGMEFLVKQ